MPMASTAVAAIGLTDWLTKFALSGLLLFSSTDGTQCGRIAQFYFRNNFVKPAQRLDLLFCLHGVLD